MERTLFASVVCAQVLDSHVHLANKEICEHKSYVYHLTVARVNMNIVSLVNSQPPLSTANSDSITPATLTNRIVHVADTNYQFAVYPADPLFTGFL